MYYGLKKTARLRKEAACVFLFHVHNMGKMNLINPLLAMLLALCDGQRGRDELVRTLSEVFGWEKAKSEEQVTGFLKGLGSWLDRSETPFDAQVAYDPGDFLYDPVGDPRKQRVTAPLEVAWMVTQRCPYNCLYCCVETFPASSRPADEMTREQSMRFLEDCVETGVEFVHLYGGEPFLRPDVPDMVEYLLSHGVHLRLSTKLKLSEKVVARLAAAGLESMQVSVDSAVPEIADRLVHLDNYLSKAYHTIDLLKRYGLHVSVNTVVTSHNIHTIPQLLRQLAQRGVDRASMARYLHSYRKHDERLLPSLEQIETLRREIDEIRAETGLVIDMFAPKSPRQASLEGKGYTSCAGGLRGLAVDAAGNASFCDRLLPFAPAQVGNVTRSSLQEIWDGPRRRRFVEPDDELLADTECATCGLKTACNQRMRCAYRSFVVDGRLFGPDYLCHPVPEPPVRFF